MTQHKEGYDARTARKAVSPSSRGSDGGGGAASGMRQWVGLGAGPVLLLLMLLIPVPEGLRVEGWRVAATGLLMAIWWITEALPIPITALVPLVLFPVLGIAGIEAAAAPYANPLIGTLPNALLAGFVNATYGVEIGFAQWMLIGLPTALTGLVAAYFLLTRVLLLFGGGLSLAEAISDSGLAAWIGQALGGPAAHWPLLATILVLTAMVVVLTELASNTASAAALLPIVASVAVGAGQNPFVLAVPVAVAASCAFMLPVATPPNAVVYGSGVLTIPDMARAGLFLNVFFVVLITAITYLLVFVVFGAAPGVVPPWAA